MTKAIIFDMDGTILDTIGDIRNSINHALELMGMPTHDADKVKMAVSSAARIFITRMVPKGTSDEDIEKTYRLFQDHYDKHNAILTKPYDGIIPLLKSLRDKGFKLAVVSNKYDYLVSALNTRMFQGLFDVSVGVSDAYPIKPAPDMVHHALDALGAVPERTLYIGDSDIDVKTAKNAHLKMVGVTWGFRPEQTLIDHGADLIARSVSELAETLDKETETWL